MKVLVINAGSSSLKYQLIDMTDETVLAKGNCERIGMDGKLTYKAYGQTFEENADFPTHTEAFLEVTRQLVSGKLKVIDSLDEINAVGHRIVQGAEIFTKAELVTDDVIEKIQSICDLAPLHNPAHLLGIRACREVFNESVPQVVVFDTSFHQTMPQKAFLYGIPYRYYEKYHIRKYGFHGTSHRYVLGRYVRITQKKAEGRKIVTCHLGNGSSLAAIQDGQCIDTTMGFTPLDGLLMGTRSGAIDPSAVLYLMEKEHLSPKEMSDLLNKKSGFLGVSGVSSDLRDVEKAAERHEKQAYLIHEILEYQIQKYIGSYAAAMGGLDTIIFTGGIGENSWSLREGVCSKLKFLGVELDHDQNVEFSGHEGPISKIEAPVDVWVIPTNEELVIARDTLKVIREQQA